MSEEKLSYTIWRDGEVLVSGFEGTEFDDLNLSYSTTYCYVITSRS